MQLQLDRQRIAKISTGSIDRPVGKVEKLHRSINNTEAQSDKGVYAASYQSVNYQLLKHNSACYY